MSGLGAKDKREETGSLIAYSSLDREGVREREIEKEIGFEIKRLERERERERETERRRERGRARLRKIEGTV